MEGKKNIRPASQSPSIKRTPTVKRGPVPPRVNKGQSTSNKPQMRPKPTANIKGNPKIGSSSRSSIKPVPKAKVSNQKDTKGNSKKLLLIVSIVLLLLILVSLFAPILPGGKTLVSTLSSKENVEVDKDVQVLKSTTEEINIIEGNPSEELDDVELDLTESETTTKPSSDTKVESTPEPTGVLPSESDMISQKTGQHYVVLGSFKNKNNAYNLKNKVGGNASIIAPNSRSNLYKVALGGFGTIEEANNVLASNMEKYGTSIWVLTY